MGWLRNFGKSFDELALRDPHFERDSAEWALWASEHGWTYQAERPELEGRYRPKLQDGAERYLHVLTAQLHGLAVIAFEHRRFVRSKQSDPIHGWLAYLALRLPGRPPKEFAEKRPAQEIRRLGGSVPSGLYLELVGDELVTQRQDHINPTRHQPDTAASRRRRTHRAGRQPSAHVLATQCVASVSPAADKPPLGVFVRHRLYPPEGAVVPRQMRGAVARSCAEAALGRVS